MIACALNVAIGSPTGEASTVKIRRARNVALIW